MRYIFIYNTIVQNMQPCVYLKYKGSTSVKGNIYILYVFCNIVQPAKEIVFSEFYLITSLNVYLLSLIITCR